MNKKQKSMQMPKPMPMLNDAEGDEPTNVILHPHGESGYANNATMQQQNKITIMKWYKYYLHTQVKHTYVSTIITKAIASNALAYFNALEEDVKFFVQKYNTKNFLKQDVCTGAEYNHSGKRPTRSLSFMPPHFQAHVRIVDRYVVLNLG